MAVTGFGRVLTWKDFPKVAKSKDPPHLAFTVAKPYADGKKITCVKGSCTALMAYSVRFNPSLSWVVNTAAAQTPALLAHEQGHYDIAAIAARDMERAITATSAASQAALLAALRKLTDAILDEMDAMNKAYDGATTNGTGPSPQNRWEGKIAAVKLDATKALADIP